MPGIARRISLFTQQEIRSLIRSARLVSRQPGLDIRIAPSLQAFGRILIVTPRASGNSPARNLIRRRFKALFYQEKLYELGHDVVIFCKKESAKLDYHQLKAILSNALQTATTSTNS